MLHALMLQLFIMLLSQVPWFHMVVDGELVSELSASLSPQKLNHFKAELAAHKAKAPISRNIVNTDLAAEPQLAANRCQPDTAQSGVLSA